MGLEKVALNLPKIERSESTFKLEQRLTILEQSNQSLGQKVIKLESENIDLKATLKKIEIEQKEDTLEDLIIKLDKDNIWLTKRVQEVNKEDERKYSEYNQMNSKLQKDFIEKVNQLEQADVYLQETTKQVMEKLTSLESMLKISAHSNDDTKNELLMLKDSMQSMHTEQKLIQNKSALQNRELLAKSNTHLNNKQVPLQHGKKFQMSCQEISTTNFSDTKSVVSISLKISLTNSLFLEQSWPRKGNHGSYTKL